MVSLPLTATDGCMGSGARRPDSCPSVREIDGGSHVSGMTTKVLSIANGDRYRGRVGWFPTGRVAATNSTRGRQRGGNDDRSSIPFGQVRICARPAPNTGGCRARTCAGMVNRAGRLAHHCQSQAERRALLKSPPRDVRLGTAERLAHDLIWPRRVGVAGEGGWQIVVGPGKHCDEFLERREIPVVHGH